MKNIFKKIFICVAVILIWIDIDNILHISFQTKDLILLATFLLSSILPYIIKKSVVIPTGISLLITVLISLYENAYIVWAAPSLCLLYAYRFSSYKPKNLQHKFRLKIFGLILLGIICTLIPLIPRLKYYNTSYYNLSYDFLFIVIIFILLSFVAFYEAFYKKIAHMEKQIKKLFASVYIIAAVCCILTGVFCRLITYFLYCHSYFIFMPWIILICFILCNDDDCVKAITDKVDTIFDKFSKIDLEKK